MEQVRRKIILVDDVKTNLAMGKDLLKTFYEVYPVLSAERLFELMENVTPDLILLDIEMPQINGYEAIQRLKADERFADIPVIFLTAKDDESSEMEGFDLGAVDYVTKPFSGPLLLKRISNQLLISQQKKELLANQEALSKHADNLEVKVCEKTAEVLELQNAIISTMADLVEFRDKMTGGHVARTQKYLRILVEAMIERGIYTDVVLYWDLEFFLLSAQLHDVGKIAISDLILNKPGKLTSDEFVIMMTHVPMGVDAIEQIINKTSEHAFLNHAVLIAGTHHEKWDGTGYPVGLRGENIPLEGRLMAIADVYDALISVRPYKEAFTHEEACRIIEESSGTQFDPVLIEVFRAVEDQFAQVVSEFVG
ncbi:MAG: response regulator [Coriobacteriia bacterium]|nr:response regulator [Coriobacteriia bacterium]MCL2750021.1 response regulator [Coriobacteriia bacterium]